MAQPWWAETVIKQAQSDIARAKEAMKGQVFRPILRGPNVRPQVEAAIAAPEQYPLDARARLASMLYARYGEQARNVAPYLGLDESQSPQGVP